MSDKIQKIKEKEDFALQKLEEATKELENDLFQEKQKLEPKLKTLRLEYIEKEKQEIKSTEEAALNEVESIKQDNDAEINKILEKKDQEKSKLVDKIIENLLNE